METKKLIEVALPLDKINEASAYEKMPGIGAHPRGIHLWWARRPFTAARAVIWASIIDDPSSHPEIFPTDAEQIKERERLFKILSDLSDWKNSANEDVINAARAEIIKATGGNPPELLDPFAGGGAIPLEGMRLGLKSHAHDLNPIAIMINKAMIEIPGRFLLKSAVNPDSQNRFAIDTSMPFSIAEDVRYYGDRLKDIATKLLGDMYPKVSIPREQGGGQENAIAWIWTRTVKCPNPACGCSMPLASGFSLAKKKGRAAYIYPVIDKKNKKIIYTVKNDGGKIPEAGKTARGAKFKCIMCGESTTPDYIKDQANGGKMGTQLMAVVAERKGGKIYVTPDSEQELAANVSKPDNYPTGEIGGDRRALWTPLYGLTDFSDLFTNRQLTTLTALSDIVISLGKQIEKDAVCAGMSNDHIPLSANGTGALAYAQAIQVYLAFAIDRLADFSTAVSRWAVSNEKAMNCFNKQAIPMTWDFPEVNILGNAVGSISQIISYISDCIETLPATDIPGEARQHNAQADCGLRNIMVSTDPPYYDNIGYADLSDFFYIWMRRTLKDIYPEIFNTMLVPKAEELTAIPYRFDGSTDQARDFFEDGMLETCKQIYKYAKDDIPVTIYYAYKQSETDEDEGTSSSGWETMLKAIIDAGFAITGTWPMRTEQAYRAVSMGTNALASSIVLVCRKRPEDAPQTTRRNLINILRRELRPALKKLQDSNIAPVDLAQSAIGPGMGVFSRYRRVLDADGTPMSIRSALRVINEEIDLYFNEQIGSMDTASRFCVDLYTQCAYNDIKYGEAEVLANAKGTSIPMMASHGVLYAKAGIVHLVERDEMPEKVDSNESNIWMLTQQLTRAMAKGGVNACAEIVASMFGSNAEYAKDLAYRLYTIAERKGWATEAYAYNNLVVSWPDIQSVAAELKEIKPEQVTLFDLE